MRSRRVVALPFALSGFLLLAWCPPVAGQASSSAAESWEAPRTPWGHPDLQGNWTNETLTSLQRPADLGPVYTPERVRELEEPEGDCPPDPGTVECGRPAPDADDDSASPEARLSGREYEEVFWDRGSRVAIVNGEPRTSLVTRPADGRIPDLTPEGEARVEAHYAYRDAFEQYDHPEMRPLAERCLVSFGSSAGPPMIPNSAYNNNYTIVQGPDHILIQAEMVHDARIIRLGEPAPLPEHVQPWFGDSWGRWDGETLVVETTNINPNQTFRGVPPSPERTVTERFTRVDDDTVLYEFTVDDPIMYTEPWGGEIPMERLDDLLYEYACHEGNYSLTGVLSGARYEERQVER